MSNIHNTNHYKNFLLSKLAKIPFDYEDMTNLMLGKATLNLSIMEDLYYQHHPAFHQFLVYDTHWCIANLKVMLGVLKNMEKKQ